MKILAKSFDDKEQIYRRSRAKCFDGIEIFIRDNILSDFEKYKDLIGFAKCHFETVNFEVSWGVNLEGKMKDTCLISPNPKVKDKSRKLLERVLELNEKKGTVNTHLAGIPRLIDSLDISIPSPREQLEEIGGYLHQFKDQGVILENIIAYDPITADKEDYVYVCGADMEDFVFMYNQFRIPINLDTAHLAISLKQYTLAETNLFRTKDRGFKNPEFTEARKELGIDVSKRGLMSCFMEQIQKLPEGAIGNVHFINGAAFEDGFYQDGYFGFSKKGKRLLDLDRVLSYLVLRGDVPQMVTEVTQTIYAPKNPNYTDTPQMVQMARELRKKLQDKK